MLIAQSVYSGKNSVVHELQVSAWQPHVEGTYTLYEPKQTLWRFRVLGMEECSYLSVH
jgi:hypothetical protein